MPQVYNWQLKRNMQYEYETAMPSRQIAGVFDINKCIGCQTCSLACKTTWTGGKDQEYMFWNNVETKPYGHYPIGWDINLLKKLGRQHWENGVYKGKTVFEAGNEDDGMLGFTPEEEDWAFPNIGEDENAGGNVERGMYIGQLPHPIWFFYLARICNHCSYPGCLAACSRKSIYKRKEDGIVLIDQSRCRGYRECVRGCPYKKAMFREATGMSEKCIGCYPKVEQGLLTQCFEMCIGKIRVQGFLNSPEKADPDNPVDFLVHIKKLALPLFPQFGTQPNIYYIPPIHVPENYLTQIFGPGVKEAIDSYKNAWKDEKLVGLLLLAGSSPRTFVKFKVKKGIAIGYDEKGHETSRVPLTEPITIRNEYDRRLNVFRMDIT